MIYANAEITIIDAAGSGPDFGLPGVNKTKGAPQPSLKIDGVTLVSTLPSPRWSLQRQRGYRVAGRTKKGCFRKGGWRLHTSRLISSVMVCTSLSLRLRQ